MRKVVVQNLSDRPLNVAIEPWADHEIVPPDGRITFEYLEYDEPAEIEFAVRQDGSVIAVVFSDIVKVAGPSGEKLFKHPWRNKDLDSQYGQ